MPLAATVPVLTFLLLLASLPRWLQAQQLQPLASPPAAPQITTSIHPNVLVRLGGDVSPLARIGRPGGLAPASTPLDHILLILRRSPERQQALAQFMREQYDSSSPNFHRWLTPEEFGELYGPSSADVQKVTTWLGQQGFTVNHTAAGGLFIDFSGTAAQVEASFHTAVRYYSLPGQTKQGKLLFANSTAPMIPAALAPAISGFRSLTNFHPAPEPRLSAPVRLDRQTGKWEHLTSQPGPGAQYLVGPRDYAEIYGINQVWSQSIKTANGAEPLVGTGQTIGIAGDTDLASSDITSFRDQFGINVLGPHGGVMVDHPPVSICPAPDPARNDGEGYIDAEWAGAMAPDATIDFVACGDEAVTSGADLAAAWMINDPAHAAKIGVLSTSFGLCEQSPQSETDQFYVSLWQQAAAEGITVVVATGDSGGAECDEFTGNPFATSGLGVNAEASTPYNIAAGGTDFSDTFSGTTTNYWLPQNGPNLESAKSYIPEMAWNDTCASPAVLAAFGNGLTTSSGPDGFCSVASRQITAVPPPFFSLFAGSGGLSTVSQRPGWQKGVAGLPPGNQRALPDISMFASSGVAWGHTLLFCDSTLLPAGMSCDLSDPTNVDELESGGTSFVAPAFAGVMALINQKYGRQGQANNVLYALAASQYTSSTSTSQPDLATCAAYLGPGVLPTCYFHDISSTPNPDPLTQAQTPSIAGTTAVPCSGTASAPGTYSDTSTDPASNREDCSGYQITVTQNGAQLTTSHDYFGILSTADGSPAFSATPGYDLATGLGSPNVAALINAPEWSGLSITNTSLPNGAVGAAYSENLSASGRVPPYDWSVTGGNLPNGLSLDRSGRLSGSPTAPGVFAFTVQVADSETPAAMATIQLSLIVTAPAATSTSLTSSAASVGPGQPVTFTATITGGATPGGTVDFYNGSDVIGTSPVANGSAQLTTSFASAGSLSIHAVYSGDGMHLGSTSNTLVETVVTPGLTITANPESLIVPFGGTGVTTVTATPRGGLTGNISFSCGALPRYLACTFAPATLSLSSGNAAATVLTIHTSPSSLASDPSSGGSNGRALAAAAFWPPAFLLSLLGWKQRKKFSRPGLRALLLVALPAVMLVGIAGILTMGCGGSARATPDGAYTIPVQANYPGGNQSMNITVHVQ